MAKASNLAIAMQMHDNALEVKFKEWDNKALLDHSRSNAEDRNEAKQELYRRQTSS